MRKSVVTSDLLSVWTKELALPGLPGVERVVGEVHHVVPGEDIVEEIGEEEVFREEVGIKEVFEEVMVTMAIVGELLKMVRVF